MLISLQNSSIATVHQKQCGTCLYAKLIALIALERLSGMEDILFHIFSTFILSALTYFCNLVCNVTVYSGAGVNVPMTRFAVGYDAVPDFPWQFTDT